MKKIFVLIATLVFSIFLFPFGFTPAIAEESTETHAESVKVVETDIPSVSPTEEENDKNDGVIPETEESKWFDEKVMPYILEYGTAALGVLTGLVLVLRKLKKTIGDLIGAYKALKKSNEDNETTKENVSALGTSIKEWQQEQTENLQEWQDKQEESLRKWAAEQVTNMENGFKQIAAAVTDKLSDTCDTVHKILNVEEIAYEENPVLVSRGTAKKIAEVIHNGTEEAKDESSGQA